MLLYQIGLKLGLSVGTVLTSRQIPCSPNFSRTVDSDAIGKWVGGRQRSSLALLHQNLHGEHPPSLPHSLFQLPPLVHGINERTDQPRATSLFLTQLHFAGFYVAKPRSVICLLLGS